MFSKSKNKNTSGSAQKPAAPAKPSVPSIISADLKMTGDLNSEGEIQVDGKIVGDIRTKSLLIGKTAEIKGEIIADTVRVHGNVNGQIKARAVTLAKTAHVIGDILHEDLSIETGAFLEGLCKRMTDSEIKDSGKMNVVEGGGGKAQAASNDPQKAANSS